MELAYLWRAFNRIRRRVPSNGLGANPISWPDIDAFCRHSKFYLAPWEVATIEMLDDLYIRQQARSQSGNPSPTDEDED